MRPMGDMEMGRIAWLTTAAGFERVEIAEECERYRKVRILSSQTEAYIPPEGIPNGPFHPALYETEQEPKVFRYKGRSLRIRDASEFRDEAQAKALVPEQQPYVFQSHTGKLLDAANEGDHVLLVGHKGTGKTSSVLQVAARICQPVVRLNFTGQLSVSDLVGSVGFGAGGTVWRDGPVITAMRNGYWLLLDEFDFGEASVMSLFHSILERKPSYCLKENDGEVVVADPRFRAFATGNSIGGDADGMYAGTESLNAALLDRFAGHGQVITVEPMPLRQEREVLRQLLPHVPDRIIRRASAFAMQVRAKHLKAFSTRELVNFVNKIVLYRDAVEAAETTFLPVVRDEAVRKAVKEFTRDWFPGRFVLTRTEPQTPPETAGGAVAGNAEPPTAPTATPLRKSSEVTDPSEMEAIWKAYRGNGGELSYAEVERKFGLRPARGNHAFRVMERWERLRKERDANAGSPGAGWVGAPETDKGDS